MGQVADEPLASLIPTIRALAGATVDTSNTPVRLFNLLTKNRSADWDHLMLLAPSDVLKWRGGGRKSAQQLLGLAVIHGLLLHSQPEMLSGAERSTGGDPAAVTAPAAEIPPQPHESIRLTEVLPFAERLAPSELDRLLLRSGLGMPGMRGAHIPPIALDERIAVQRFAELLSEAMMASVANQPLVTLVPILDSSGGDAVDLRDTSARLFHLLKKHERCRWDRIKLLRPIDVLRWGGAGKKSARQLLQLGIVRGLVLTRRERAMPEIETGSAIASCDTSAGEGTSPATSEPTHAEVQAVVKRVVAELDPRQITIFLCRTLAVRDALKLDDLADRLRVTRERVRQLEPRMLDVVTTAMRRPENRALAAASAALRGRLGPAQPLAAVDPAILCPGSTPDLQVPTESLVLWVAGPYEIWRDWLVLAPARELVRASLAKVKHVLVKGFVPEEEAARALESLKINDEVRVAWLKALPGLTGLRGHVVRPGRTIADRAEILLRLNGSPMCKEEIAVELGGDFSVRSLGNYLQRDQRFLRRGLNHYGLSEWGGEEYTKITDEIAQEIEREGGEASLDHLVRTLTGNFGVSEVSVRAYAQGPHFMRTNRGTFVTRAEPATARSGRSIELTKNCYRIGDRWALRIVVSRETLRGSGTQIPSGFATVIGLNPGGSVEFSSSHGQIRFGWPSLQPHMGSVRCAAAALRASEGDCLFIRVVSSRRVEFSIARQAVLTRLSPPRRLAREIGLDGVAPHGELLRLLGHAIGLDGVIGLADVERRLVLREEQNLLEVLPRSALPDREGTASNVDRLTRVLGRIISRRSEA